MRIEIRHMQPIEGTHDLQVPKGSKLLTLRMDRSGLCVATFAVPDVDAQTTTVTALILLEELVAQSEGDPSEWRHVGQWIYNNGNHAHAFVRDGKPAPKARRKAKVEKVEKVETEAKTETAETGGENN